MAGERRRLLWLVGLTVTAVAALVLSAVIETVLVAIAASYVLLPVHRWTIRRGLKPYWSAMTTTVVGVVGTLLVVVPIGFVLYVRREVVVDSLQRLSGEVTLFVVSDQPVVLDLGAIREGVVPGLSDFAVSVAQSLSTLSAKFVVFAFVVFALLYYHESLRGMAFGPVPAAYHEVIDRVHRRVRGVLFGHYVLAFVGGGVTYALGLVVFLGLGYEIPFFLALVGAVLWVLPYVSAAPLVFVLTVIHAVSGELVMALTVGVVGAVALVAAPRVVVQVARRTFGQPSGLDHVLYFVGFVGGGLTIGLVGVVIGPIALAVLTALSDAVADDSPISIT